MAAFTFAQVNWSTGTESEQTPLQVVSGNYFGYSARRPRSAARSCRKKI